MLMRLLLFKGLIYLALNLMIRMIPLTPPSIPRRLALESDSPGVRSPDRCSQYLSDPLTQNLGIGGRGLGPRGTQAEHNSRGGELHGFNHQGEHPDT